MTDVPDIHVGQVDGMRFSVNSNVT
jgi:hypothetical protein